MQQVFVGITPALHSDVAGFVKYPGVGFAVEAEQSVTTPVVLFRRPSPVEQTIDYIVEVFRYFTGFFAVISGAAVKVMLVMGT